MIAEFIGAGVFALLTFVLFWRARVERDGLLALFGLITAAATVLFIWAPLNTRTYENSIKKRYPQVAEIVEINGSNGYEFTYRDSEGRLCFANKGPNDKLYFEGCVKKDG